MSDEETILCSNTKGEEHGGQDEEMPTPPPSSHPRCIMKSGGTSAGDEGGETETHLVIRIAKLAIANNVLCIPYRGLQCAFQITKFNCS